MKAHVQPYFFRRRKPNSKQLKNDFQLYLYRTRDLIDWKSWFREDFNIGYKVERHLMPFMRSIKFGSMENIFDYVLIKCNKWCFNPVRHNTTRYIKFSLNSIQHKELAERKLAQLRCDDARHVMQIFRKIFPGVLLSIRVTSQPTIFSHIFNYKSASVVGRHINNSLSRLSPEKIGKQLKFFCFHTSRSFGLGPWIPRFHSPFVVALRLYFN